MIDCEFVKELRDALAGPYRDKHIRNRLWDFEGNYCALGVACKLKGEKDGVTDPLTYAQSNRASVNRAFDGRNDFERSPLISEMVRINNISDSFEPVVKFLDGLLVEEITETKCEETLEVV